MNRENFFNDDNVTCVLNSCQQQSRGDAGGYLVVVVHLLPAVLHEAVSLLEHQDQHWGRAQVRLVPVSLDKLQVRCPLK